MEEKLIVINESLISDLIGYIHTLNDFVDVESLNKKNRSLVVDGYDDFVKPVYDILHDPKKAISPFRLVKNEKIDNFRCNLEDIYDTDVSMLLDEDIEEILDDVEDTLANDDVYNECYNNAVWRVLKEKGLA